MDVFKERRSIRKFRNTPVPEELIREITEAGIYAACGKGLQSPVVIAVTDKELRDRFAKENSAIMGVEKDPFYGAPAILVVLADKSVPTYVYDGSLMLGNMMLKAKEVGLGTCWIHRAKQEFESPFGKELLDKLGIQGDYEGIGHLALGYPDEEPEAKPRKDGRVYFI